MIIHEGIEFHNVAELVPVDHPHGLALYRYPGEVRSCLSTLGHHAAACADGVEMRLAGASGWVSVTLSQRSNYPFSDGARIRIDRGDILVEETTISVRQREYREALTRIHQTLAAPNLHLVPGDTIPTRFAGLTPDFIHPSAVGHQEMGANLARLMGDLLGR